MTYLDVEKWRKSSPERARYNPEYMKFRRKYYKTLWLEGKIAYEDIPKSYRYWKNRAKQS